MAPCEVKESGASKALVVTRFDRALHSSGRHWHRLPQEDFCQATGTPSALKYEADGGPGVEDIARILQGSQAREEDLANISARRCGIGADMETIITDIIERTPKVIDQLGEELPKSYPERIFESVTAGLQKSANRIERMRS